MVRTVQLSDGTSIPALAWGNMGGSEKALSGGTYALKSGIHHIDSAQIYGTEEEAGEAIKKAGLKRDEVYITTKLFNMPNQTKLHSREEVKKSVAGSIEKLGLIPNLLLVHNPFIPADGQLGEFWGWLEDLVEDGTLKGCSLGISNFRPVDIETVMKVAKIKPVVNQIEYHPYVMAHVQPVIDLQDKYKIVTQAYASLAPTTRHPTGGPLKPVLGKVAAALTSESGVQVDESGVLLLWIMAKGGVCITSSGSEERIQKMADLEKVRDLKKDEVSAIDEAGKKVHFRQWDEHMTTDFPSPSLPRDL